MQSEVDINLFARILKNAVNESDIVILDTPKAKEQLNDFKNIDKFVIRRGISRE